MYEIFTASWGAAHSAPPKFRKRVRNFCFPGHCTNINGVIRAVLPFTTRRFSALYAWSSYWAQQAQRGGPVPWLSSRICTGTAVSTSTCLSKFGLDVRFRDSGSGCRHFWRIGSAIINNGRPNQLRRVSGFDTRHRSTPNWVYDLQVRPATVWPRLGTECQNHVAGRMGKCRNLPVERSGCPFNHTGGRKTGTPNFQLSGNEVF